MSQFEQGALGIDNAYPEPVPDYVNPTSTSDQPLSPVGQTSISDAKPSSPTQNMRKQEGLSDELTAEDLLLFAHQIAIGMVSVTVHNNCTIKPAGIIIQIVTF